jgi:hypothetical protein
LKELFIITTKGSNCSEMNAAIKGRFDDNLSRRHVRDNASGVGMAKATKAHAMRIKFRDINIGFFVE